MTAYVVDASVVVEVLLHTTLGRQATATLLEADLVAPELVDAEVLGVLRRRWLDGRLPEERAREALEDLRDWDLERVPHRNLLEDAWRFRGNASVPDALYLAAAVQRKLPVLTADGPLARIPIQGIVVHNIRTG